MLKFVWILEEQEELHQLYMFQGHMEKFWMEMFKRESKFSKSSSSMSYEKAN